MMEHYEEALIEHSNKSSLCNVVDMEVVTMAQNESEDDVGGVGVDFGAEMIKTTTVVAGGVDLPNKTNINKLTITLAAATATSDEIDAASTTTTTTTTTTKIVASADCEAKTISAEVKNAELAFQQEKCVADDDEDEEDDEETEEDDVEKVQDSKVEVEKPEVHDESSNDSNISNLSEMSDVSGRDWKPVCTRPIRWVQKQIQTGANPRELLSQMLPAGAHQIAVGVNDMTLWRILASMLSEPPRRQKLRNINTFDDVVSLVERSRNIIVLTGAGVSVSCGIPDFRSSDGIYARLAKDFPNLPDPQAMFDINYFARDPRPFYKFAREIYPGQFRPSPCHRFIKRLEEKQKLLRNYTQNIDTLEQVAGIRNVIECHGSFSTATCTKCKFKCSAEDIRADIFAQRIPVCPRCQPQALHRVPVGVPVAHESHLRRLVEHGIMKPDIVFFGEGLPDVFHTVMASDKAKCDLLIVIGSSLKVRPVALIPSSLPAHVPQILINREQLPHLEFDVQLLGDSDIIINQLCHRLGEDWQDICFNERILHESSELLSCVKSPAPASPSSTEPEKQRKKEKKKELELELEMEKLETEQKAEHLAVEKEEEDEGNESDELPQQQDTDTQSVKSFASADLALRSSGTYSDSGFESSTSSGASARLLSVAQSSPETVAHEMDAQLQQIKTSFSQESPPPQEEPNELPSSTATAETTTCSSSCDKATKESPLDGRTVVKRHQNKRRKETECLLDGTYYCHEAKSAYVFPGAQVSWYKTDTEDDENDDEGETKPSQATEKSIVKSRHVSGQSTSKRHPLLANRISPKTTKSTSTITTTTTPNVKRRSADEATQLAEASCDVPAVKRRRDSTEPQQQQQAFEDKDIAAGRTTPLDQSCSSAPDDVADAVAGAVEEEEEAVAVAKTVPLERSCSCTSSSCCSCSSSSRGSSSSRSPPNGIADDVAVEFCTNTITTTDDDRRL